MIVLEHFIGHAIGIRPLLQRVVSDTLPIDEQVELGRRLDLAIDAPKRPLGDPAGRGRIDVGGGSSRTIWPSSSGKNSRTKKHVDLTPRASSSWRPVVAGFEDRGVECLSNLGGQIPRASCI